MEKPGKGVRILQYLSHAIVSLCFVALSYKEASCHSCAKGESPCLEAAVVFAGLYMCVAFLMLAFATMRAFVYHGPWECDGTCATPLLWGCLYVVIFMPWAGTASLGALDALSVAFGKQRADPLETAFFVLHMSQGVALLWAALLAVIYCSAK